MSLLILFSEGSPAGPGEIFLGYEQYVCYVAFVVALCLLRRSLARARAEALGTSSPLGLPAGRLLRRTEVRPFVLGLHDPGHPTFGKATNTALANGLVIFENGGSVQEVLSSVKDDFESLSASMDSGLGLVRYLIWAIPAVGFVGTVRGMGDALASASLETAGTGSDGDTMGNADVTGMLDKVTEHLGVAFYSTLVALLLSLALMWIFHHVQEVQEKTVLDVQGACRKEIIRVLQT